MSNHVVHTVSIVLPAHDYNEAAQHQAASKHWAKHSFPILLNNYLDQLTKDDEILFIDKITINITEFPWNLPDAAWQQKLAGTILPGKSSFNSLGVIVRQWFFYLQNGCFEKKAIPGSRQAIETYLLARLDALTEDLLQPYATTISLPLLQRLFFQHSKELVSAVLEKILRLRPNELAAVYSAVLRQLKDEPYKTCTIISKIAAANGQAAAKTKAEWIAVLSGKESSQVEEEIPNDYLTRVTEETKKVKEHPEDVFIDCPHAGLVLLFPYLQRFFENCQLVQDGAFVSEAARQTGIQALLYMATGKSLSNEELVVFPKLLCGLPMEAYISFEQELAATLQAEGDGLLQSVIEHWKVLQHTSVDGLRETFLSRNGRLMRRGEIYTLQVEESGVDILLNSIPWGFRNYKLPWMSFTLITEWY